jgi:hypothetical protein
MKCHDFFPPSPQQLPHSGTGSGPGGRSGHVAVENPNVAVNLVDLMVILQMFNPLVIVGVMKQQVWHPVSDHHQTEYLGGKGAEQRRNERCASQAHASLCLSTPRFARRGLRHDCWRANMAGRRVQVQPMGGRSTTTGRGTAACSTSAAARLLSKAKAPGTGSAGG